ncbi:hypothetical protein L1887_24840 [Cichorium endivia]|nr:hypothetical protein L1887_24840 [Cichorium endivia]
MAEWVPTTPRPSFVTGLVGPNSGDRDRFRLLGRRERVVAVCEMESRWVMRGERELNGEETESPGEGEMTKRRRRSSDMREESRAARALLSISVLRLGGYFVKKWWDLEEIVED